MTYPRPPLAVRPGTRGMMAAEGRLRDALLPAPLSGRRLPLARPDLQSGSASGWWTAVGTAGGPSSGRLRRRRSERRRGCGLGAPLGSSLGLDKNMTITNTLHAPESRASVEAVQKLKYRLKPATMIWKACTGSRYHAFLMSTLMLQSKKII